MGWGGFFIGLFVGCFFGVVFMCLLQTSDNEEDDL